MIDENEFYHQLIENISDGIYYVDQERKIKYWNAGAERITGYKKEEVIGSKCSDNLLKHINEHGTELCLTGCPLTGSIRDGKIHSMDIYLHHKDGHRVPVSVRVSPIKDEAGNITGAVEVFSDKGKSVELLKEIGDLRRELFIDPLTQVGNRRMAEQTLNLRQTEWRDYQVTFGILFIDIDNFKTFNDQYGHNIGDQVLKMVAKTVDNLLRGMDTITRWGGEEFLIIVSNINSQTLASVGERIRIFIEKSWLHLEAKELKVTVSIGGAIAQKNEANETLIHRADTQMYKSKENGKNCVSIDMFNINYLD
ncbi:MAG: sensor domain-containing diguanylate cyclase [Microcoleaceae cyanobacterium]